MLVESICIILILSIMIFVFLRSGRKDYAISTSPLLIVPFFHTVSNLIYDLFSVSINVNVKAIVDVLGLAIAVAIIGFIAGQHKTKASRVGYLIICAGFTTVLTIIFIYNYYSYLIER